MNFYGQEEDRSHVRFLVPLTLLAAGICIGQQTSFLRCRIPGQSATDIRVTVDRNGSNAIRWGVISYRGDLGLNTVAGSELRIRRIGGPLSDESEFVLPINAAAGVSFSGQSKILPDDSAAAQTAERLIANPKEFEAVLANLDEQSGASVGAIERANRTAFLARLTDPGAAAYVVLASTNGVASEVTSARLTIGARYRASTLPGAGELRITNAGKAIWAASIPAAQQNNSNDWRTFALALEPDVTGDAATSIALLESSPKQFSIELVPAGVTQPALTGTLGFSEVSSLRMTLNPMSPESSPVGVAAPAPQQ